MKIEPYLDVAAITGDADFVEAFIDVDEMRRDPRPHRYVHGGFHGNETRFSIYLPAHKVATRLLHWVEGGPGGSETSAVMGGFGLDVAFRHECILIESNQGHVAGDFRGIDPSIWAYRASLASARVAINFALSAGHSVRKGYLLGGSGGAWRAVTCLEQASDLYSGAVAFMSALGATAPVGSNPPFPYWCHSAALHWPLMAYVCALADSHEADAGEQSSSTGHEGELYDAGMRALYRAGFPRGAEFLLARTAIWVLGMKMVLAADPDWPERFWMSSSPRALDLAGRRRKEMVTVAEVIWPDDALKADARTREGLDNLRDDVIFQAQRTGVPRLDPRYPAAVRLAGLGQPTAAYTGYEATILDGPAASRVMTVTGELAGGLAAGFDAGAWSQVRVGDRVALDNANYLAYSAYWGSQVDPALPGMEQFLENDEAQKAATAFLFDQQPHASGVLLGKVILLQHTLDREAWPTGGHHFSGQLRQDCRYDPEEQFRFYWVENAAHFPPSTARFQTRLVPYGNYYAQAVADMIDWEERQVEPPPSTKYAFDIDWGLHLAAGAQRSGVQAAIDFDVVMRSERRTGFALRVHTSNGSGPLESVAWTPEEMAQDWHPLVFREEAEGIFVAEWSYEYPQEGCFRATVKCTTCRHASDYRLTNIASVYVDTSLCMPSSAGAGGRE